MNELELRNRVVSGATEWLGRKESDGSYWIIVDTYNNYTPLPVGYKVQPNDAWCATFVSAVGIKTGFDDIMFPECSCPRMISLYQAAGRWQENDAYIPRPGDIIMYDWQDTGFGDNQGNADHVGIVTSVDGTTMQIIEGNNGGAVAYRTLSVGGKYIRGYCLPDYARKCSITQPVQQPELLQGRFYTDTVGHWAEDYIDRCTSAGLIKGKTATTFEPDSNITRAEIATVLSRLLDKLGL